jgi:DNA phosphorothioation-dependent restriction protein DptG
MVIFYSFLYVYQMVVAYFQTNSFEDVASPPLGVPDVVRSAAST